jgi:hypothetical protein
MMNKRSKIVCTISLLMGFSAPPLAFAQSANVATVLNQANQMNNQEQDEAKELRSKAEDNQALVTMADTLTQDHKSKPGGGRSSGKTGERDTGIVQTK